MPGHEIKCYNFYILVLMSLIQFKKKFTLVDSVYMVGFM